MAIPTAELSGTVVLWAVSGAVAIPTAELSGTVVLWAVSGAVAIPTAELSGTVVLWAVSGAVVCYDLTQVFLFGDGSRWRTLAGVRQKALTKHLRFGQRTPYNISRMQ